MSSNVIGKLQFRFLDPVLARKYDSDGMATALFTTVGHFTNATVGTHATESSWQWPLTIIVPANVVERMRKVLLTIMTFECTDAYERMEVLPKIVSNASFFAEVGNGSGVGTGRQTNNKQDNAIPGETNPSVATTAGWFGTVENTIELKTSDDVKRILEENCPGGDLKIWIETSSPGIFRKPGRRSPRTSTSPGFANENRDPNASESNSPLPLPSSSSSSPMCAVSSTLKKIAKAGDIGPRSPPRSPPRKSATAPIPKEVGRSFSSEAKDDLWTATITPVSTDVGTEGTTMLLDSDSAISFDTIPIPGYPIISNVGSDLIPLDFSDSNRNRTIPSTEICSNGSSGVAFSDSQNPGTDDDDSDIARLLALAGCAHRGGYGSVDDVYCSDHEDDGFLSGLLIGDDEYHSHEDNQVLFTNEHGHVSAFTRLTYSYSHDTIGSNPSAKSDTKTFLMPSFFETKSSLSSVFSPTGVSRFIIDASTVGNGSSGSGYHGDIDASSSFVSPSVASSVTLNSSISNSSSVIALVPPGKDGVVLESSSLLQDQELEMATILESVLDCIFSPDVNEKNNAGDGIDNGSVEVVPTKVLENVLHQRDLDNHPCPTPRELFAGNWNQ